MLPPESSPGTRKAENTSSQMPKIGVGRSWLLVLWCMYCVHYIRSVPHSWIPLQSHVSHVSPLFAIWRISRMFLIYLSTISLFTLTSLPLNMFHSQFGLGVTDKKNHYFIKWLLSLPWYNIWLVPNGKYIICSSILVGIAWHSLCIYSNRVRLYHVITLKHCQQSIINQYCVILL